MSTARLQYLTGKETRFETSAVVVETGVTPVSELFDELVGGFVNGGWRDLSRTLSPKSISQLVPGRHDLFCIGDTAGRQNVSAAIIDALRLCQTI